MPHKKQILIDIYDDHHTNINCRCLEAIWNGSHCTNGSCMISKDTEEEEYSHGQWLNDLYGAEESLFFMIQSRFNDPNLTRERKEINRANGMMPVITEDGDFLYFTKNSKSEAIMPKRSTSWYSKFRPYGYDLNPEVEIKYWKRIFDQEDSNKNRKDPNKDKDGSIQTNNDIKYQNPNQLGNIPTSGNKTQKEVETMSQNNNQNDHKLNNKLRFIKEIIPTTSVYTQLSSEVRYKPQSVAIVQASKDLTEISASPSNGINHKDIQAEITARNSRVLESEKDGDIFTLELNAEGYYEVPLQILMNMRVILPEGYKTLQNQINGEESPQAIKIEQTINFIEQNEYQLIDYIDESIKLPWKLNNCKIVEIEESINVPNKEINNKIKIIQSQTGLCSKKQQNWKIKDIPNKVKKKINKSK